MTTISTPNHTTPTNNITMTIWNAGGCGRLDIDQVTKTMPMTDLLFVTETWLLSPLRLISKWNQFHTYALPVDNTFRGQMGISLLVHPDCPYTVTHFPSLSPYVLSCQVSNLLIHCVYLPPALSDTDALDIIHFLPLQTHSSQNNTIICGDFNARHKQYLGDSRTSPRGTMLTQELHNPKLIVYNDLSFGSDHSPVALSCAVLPPPAQPDHPRLLWNLSQDSVGPKKPGARGNAWFWTPDLQFAFDYREECHKLWKRASGLTKGLRWRQYLTARSRYDSTLKSRKRTTWKEFSTKLCTGPLADTTSIISRMRRNRTTSPQFSHPEGPRVAACKMAEHLQKVFAGSTLPNNRYTAPPVPEGPHDPTDYPCPIDTSVVSHALLKRLARRKAPGADHLRTEMLLPIAKDIIPVITLLFQLCWKWSTVPLAWRTAQVIPIFKKGNPMDPGNYRPISLTSIMRKLLELCLQEELVAAAPPLDPVQGGFLGPHERTSRSSLLGY
ncbi:hypothetical protein G6F56_006469 [Rhizopus delemar]|nr:hypothetical protein G6F56_006469 [Rhizopus delemar]